MGEELVESARNYLREGREAEQRYPVHETLSLFTRARDTARLAGDSALEFDALTELGWNLAQEDVTAGVEFLREALKIASYHTEWRRIPYPVNAVEKGFPSVSPIECEARLAAALGRMGDSGGCLALASAVGELRLRAVSLNCLMWLGEAFTSLGMFERAVDLLTEMPFQTGTVNGINLSVARDFCAMGELYVMWRKPELAQGYLNLAWETAWAKSWRGIVCRSGVARARYFMAEELPGRKPKAALTTAFKVLDVAWQDGRYVDAAGALLVVAQCRLEFGDVDQAVKAAQDACEYARSYPGMPVALREEAFVVLQKVARITGRELLAGEVALDPMESFSKRVASLEDADVRRTMKRRMAWGVEV